MSRSGNTRAIERRVRRVATRLGLHLMIVSKPDKRVLAHGGYMLRDDDTKEIVFGNTGYDFSATLDEVEAFLTESRDAMHADRKKKKK